MNKIKLKNDLISKEISVSEEFKRYIGNRDILTEYDLIEYIKKSKNEYPQPVISIEDIELVQKYGDISDFIIRVRNEREYKQVINLVKKDSQTILINKEVLQQISGETINSSDKIDIILQLDNMGELGANVLNHVKDKVEIRGIYISTNSEDILENRDIYTINQYKILKAEMDKILKKIDLNKPDLEKFLDVYQILGKNIEYEYDEDGEPSSREEAHNLEDGLLKKRCVCEGYAKILQQVLKCVGINCKLINGAVGPDERHAWNQVELGNKWYNCDLTWDAASIKEKRLLDYCLQSDDDFILHIPETQNKEICNESYNKNEINSYLGYITALDFKEKEYSAEEIISLFGEIKEFSQKGIRAFVQTDAKTGKYYLCIGNIINNYDIEWSENKVIVEDLKLFLNKYLQSYTISKIKKDDVSTSIKSNQGIELLIDEEAKQQLGLAGFNFDEIFTTEASKTKCKQFANPEDFISNKIYEIINYALAKVIRPDITVDKVTQLNEKKISAIKEKYGVEGIILDVDETLRKNMSEIPTCNKEWIESLRGQLKIIIVSNGIDKKIGEFFKEKGIDYIELANKPLKKNFIKACKKMDIEPEKVLVIGDSILDDIYGGKRNNMKTALVKEVEDER